jgi:hypothetical protein
LPGGEDLCAAIRTFGDNHRGGATLKRLSVVVLFTTVLLAAALPRPADAASKYKPCSLLTTAEVEAVLGAKVIGTSERDVPITEGPYKGETHSMCTWTTAKGGVMVTVSRGPRTPEERAAATAEVRKMVDDLKQKGWTITQTNIRGTACGRNVPPASGTTATTVASCSVESKGLALSVLVFSPTVTVQQVKALLDKAVARLR